jgi:hypothetical protein
VNRGDPQWAVNCPCRLHVAVQPAGVTWTTILRAHRPQNLGGSTRDRRVLHLSCSAVWGSVRPHHAQNSLAGSLTGSRSAP